MILSRMTYEVRCDLITGQAAAPEREACPECDGPMYLETGVCIQGIPDDPEGYTLTPACQCSCHHCGYVIPITVH